MSTSGGDDVADPGWEKAASVDHLQYLELCSMQRQESEAVQKHGDVRMLDVGAVLVHNNHLQGGFRTSRACGVCSKGLAGAYASLEKTQPVGKPTGVSEGNGKDKEGDAPSAPVYGDYTPGKEDQLLASE